MITKDLLAKPFTIFMGTQTKFVNNGNGITLYESYTVGTQKKFRDTFGIDLDRSNETGAVFTTIRGSTDCSIDLSGTEDKTPIKDDITDRAEIIDLPGDFIDSEYPGFAQVDHLIRDYPLSTAFDERWCSNFPPPPSLALGSFDL